MKPIIISGAVPSIPLPDGIDYAVSQKQIPKEVSPTGWPENFTVSWLRSTLRADWKQYVKSDTTRAFTHSGYTGYISIDDEVLFDASTPEGIEALVAHRLHKRKRALAAWPNAGIIDYAPLFGVHAGDVSPAHKTWPEREAVLQKIIREGVLNGVLKDSIRGFHAISVSCWVNLDTYAYETSPNDGHLARVLDAAKAVADMIPAAERPLVFATVSLNTIRGVDTGEVLSEEQFARICEIGLQRSDGLQFWLPRGDTPQIEEAAYKVMLAAKEAA
jgi:hypothetical protein